METATVVPTVVRSAVSLNVSPGCIRAVLLQMGSSHRPRHGCSVATSEQQSTHGSKLLTKQGSRLAFAFRLPKLAECAPIARRYPGTGRANRQSISAGRCPTRSMCCS